MSKNIESKIQSEIIDYLQVLENSEKLMYNRENNTPIYDPRRGTFRAMPKGAKKGIPDIDILCQGKRIGFEVKKPEIYKVGAKKGQFKDLQSQDQKRFQRLMEKHGGFYYVVHSLDEAINILKEDFQVWL